jgi:hypothetical protein
LSSITSSTAVSLYSVFTKTSTFDLKKAPVGGTKRGQGTGGGSRIPQPVNILLLT